LPLDFVHSHQTQVDFVDQGGGLKGVARAFVAHVAARHNTQFGVNLAGQLLQGVLVAAAPGFQEMGDVGAQKKLLHPWPDFTVRRASTGDRMQHGSCPAWSKI
jgi:hypothetical protein